MIPQAIRQAVENDLNTKMAEFTYSSGGCINNGGKLSTSSGDFFLKWNRADQFPQMFEKEKRGIELLSGTRTIKVPSVNLAGLVNEWQYLVMEFVEGKLSETYWSDLGEYLAALHKHSDLYFGLDHDNYIGSLVQKNKKSESWISFFIEQRLNPQLQKLRDANRVDNFFVRSFENLYSRFGEFMPEERPSLLHGDLWSGNVITGVGGAPYCIDPAVYFGHREMEIAFTRLFGGFENTFYTAYNESFPLQPDFEQRLEIYNLYPLLVHANLFGDSYLRAVKSIIRSFK